MRKDKAKTLTPKLRFPEFRDGPGWEEKALKDVCEVNPANDGLPDSFVYIDLESVERGILLSKNRIERNGAPSRAQRVLKNGDVVFQIVRPYQRNNLFVDFDDGDTYVASTGYAQLRAYESDAFLYQLVHTDPFVEKVIAKCTGSSYPAINSNDLAEVAVLVPDRAEQRKIAACLTSLDELLAAEGRKLEALRAHKQGLMQRLFPREGESRPRLRFPEIRKDREWIKIPLSDLCDIKHGYAFESEYFSNEGEYVLLTPGNFYEEGGYRDRGEQQKYYTGEIPRDYVLAQGDMLLAMTEQAAGLLGSPIMVPQSDKFLHNQRLGLVTQKPGVAWVNEFFFHVFNTEPVRKAIHDTASGTKVRHTSPIKIGNVAVSAPTSLLEQQRIAACLSSLDALIAAQSRKLDGLRSHKQGLMQQLFPSPEEG